MLSDVSPSLSLSIEKHLRQNTVLCGYNIKSTYCLNVYRRNISFSMRMERERKANWSTCYASCRRSILDSRMTFADSTCER